MMRLTASLEFTLPSLRWRIVTVHSDVRLAEAPSYLCICRSVGLDVGATHRPLHVELLRLHLNNAVYIILVYIVHEMRSGAVLWLTKELGHL